MILYLYTPAIEIANLFSLQMDLALRVYVYFFTTLSLLCCWRILYADDKINLMATIITTAIIFLFLPLGALGQRENLMMIFIMPYLFLLSNRLASSTHAAKIFYIGVGIMAGCGFVIKPYFLIPLALLEIYYMQQTPWYYHTLAFFALSILLCARLFTAWVKNPSYNVIAVSLLTASIFLYLTAHLDYLRLSILHYPVGYFSLFAAVFGFLFYIAYDKNKLHTFMVIY
jgi:hypothetical protein